MQTKNDLSHDEVRLDYQALLQTTEAGFSELRESINRRLSSLYQYPLHSCYYLDAQHLESDAKRLVIAAETMYTLREGLTRHDVVVVNKPISKARDTFQREVGLIKAVRESTKDEIGNYMCIKDAVKVARWLIKNLPVEELTKLVGKA